LLETFSEDQGNDSHELDENVQRWTRGILKWVTNGITSNSSLVSIGSLSESFSIFVLEMSGLDVLLGVIPGTTSVRHGDGHLDSGKKGSWKDTSDQFWMEDDTEEDRGEDNQHTWGNHFSDGSGGGYLDTGFIIWVDFTISDSFVLELSSDFFDHLVGGLTDRLHSQSREEVWKHSTDEHRTEDPSVVNQNCAEGVVSWLGTSGEESTVEGEGNKSSGSDSETLTDSGGGVSSSVESISLVSNVVTDFGHFSDTTGVVGDWSIGIDSETDAEGGKHTDSSEGDSEHTQQVDTNDNGDSQQENWDDARQVTEGKSVDDVDGGTGGTDTGHFLDWSVGVGGVVVSGETDNESGEESESGTDVAEPPFDFDFSSVLCNFHGPGGWEESVSDWEQDDEHDYSRDQQLEVESSFDSVDSVDLVNEDSEEGGDETSDDSSSRDQEWVVEGLDTVSHEVAGS